MTSNRKTVVHTNLYIVVVIWPCYSQAYCAESRVSTFPARLITMRSKFKDEHPFGTLVVCAIFYPDIYSREAQGRSRAYPPEVSRSHSCEYTCRRILFSHLSPRNKVICEKADRTDIPTIDKKKYLVPSVRPNYTIRHFALTSSPSRI